MRVNSINQINFGRAFTTKEKSDYKKLIVDCKKELGIKDTTAIAFDFSIPAEDGKNTGIGSTWSNSMKEFIPFLKDMIGITSIQVQPQGKILENDTSPYAGTNFAFGEHIISLDKLTEKKYGVLLSKERLQEIDEKYPKDKVIREYRTDYSYVLGKNGIQEIALREAFDNFKKGIKNKNIKILILNQEFKKFKIENAKWLKDETDFALLKKHYGTGDVRKWDGIDANLNSEEFKNTDIKKKRIDELKKLYGDEYEYMAFVQFIADKQQKESHKFLKSQDVKVYGDCLIGFSKSEMWGNIEAFETGQYYGGPDPNCTQTNGIQTWGLPAIDYDKLVDVSTGKKELAQSGKFLLEKYKKFFERYDGVRIDAAWQFITPFIYREEAGKIKQIDIKNKDNNVFFEILDKAKKEVSTDDKNIMLELVGLSAGDSRKMTMNKYPHLYTTAYAEFEENPTDFIKKGYKPDMFYIGVGCHDNDSLINQSKDIERRKLHFKELIDNFPALKNTFLGSFNIDKEYKSENLQKTAEANYRTLKFAELFTVPNQFFTLPDMFGMSERINTSGFCNDDNWTVRIPKDFERFYFSQLSKGFGLNMPKTLSTTMTMLKKSGPTIEKLIKKCNEASKILLEDGPMTEKEANIAKEKGLLKDNFSY